MIGSPVDLRAQNRSQDPFLKCLVKLLLIKSYCQQCPEPPSQNSILHSHETVKNIRIETDQNPQYSVLPKLRMTVIRLEFYRSRVATPPPSKLFAKDALSGWTVSKILPGRRTGMEKQNGILNADLLIIMLKNLFQMNGT